MSEFELSQLFGPESVKVEYKYVVPPPKSLARLIASFANTEGGKIIFGVKDSPKPTVVGLPEGLAAWAVIQPALEHLRPRPLVNFSDDEIIRNGSCSAEPTSTYCGCASSLVCDLS